ncbi:MAG: polysaccharide deacetylase family protein, partial [Solirubrobacterales bacterium]
YEEALERVRARRLEAAERRRRRSRVLVLSAIAVGGLAVAGIVLSQLWGNGSSGDGPVTGKVTTSPPAGTNDPRAGEAGAAARDRKGWRPWKGPVPILMYHPIQEPVEGNPYPDLFLTREDFADQVRWLDRNGYQAVTLTEVLDSWFEGGTLPPKPVVLSFDDGYQSQYENAFPLMQKLGWPGVLNLKALESDIYDSQVEEMVAAGWEVASHSATHPDLPSLSDSQLEDEMVRSRRILEQQFDTQVTDFCYPAGSYDDRVIQAVREAGYRSATSTEPGLARPSDRWSLDRIRIELGDGAAELESKLASAGA